MITLPAAAISGPDDAIKVYIDAGLRPILIFAPQDGEHCYCGKKHSSSGKHPIAKSWQKSTTFDELADQLARLKFTPNIGIVLGEQWGGEYLVAIDVDIPERLDKIAEDLGPLPQTVRGESGRGYRLLFELGPEVNRDDLRNVTGLCGEPGVDVKIKGGQVVVAPSIHPSGRPYTWSRVGRIEKLPSAWALALLPKSYEIPKWAQSYTPQTMREDQRAKAKAEKYLERAVHGDASLLASTKEGSRNALLYKRTFALLSLCAGLHLGGQWGWVQQELTRAARSAGLPETEVRRTISSAERAVRESGAVRVPVSLDPNAHPPSSPRQLAAPAVQAPAEETGTAEHTDLRNAEQLIIRHADKLRSVGTWSKWLAWDRQRWNLDALGSAFECAKETARHLYAKSVKECAAANKALAEAIESMDDVRANRARREADRATEDVKHAIKTQGAGKLTAMLEVAKSDPRIVIHHEVLDADPMLLNVQNGTVNLRTGELQPHRQMDLITKLAPTVFDPNAACPTWERFLSRAMAGNVELVDFLQRAVGYALTGSVQEHVLFFCYGNGANGKSTFLGTLHSLLGEYSAPAPRGMLFRSRGPDRHPTELAMLHGMRFVTCSEIEEGQAFDEALVKDLTGGDLITARRMNEDFWKFVPSHKLWLAGNHRPVVRGDDEGIWRRMRLVPFTVTIPESERDATLPERLRLELPGILAWAVRGCVQWSRSGLAAPGTVKSATAQYREENDILGQFFRERVKMDEPAVTPRAYFREAYEIWCRETGAEPVGPRRLASRLRERAAAEGVTIGDTTARVEGHVVNAWKGVRLLTSDERFRG